MDAKGLAAQKFSYEQEINCYEGPDPLKPRYDYILWLDTNLGKENSASTLMPILVDTLTQFRDDPRYADDIRFTHLLIIYIENQGNPRNLYEEAYNQNIRRNCTLFYKSWADFLIKSGSEDGLKAAKDVYERALDNCAQPVSHLKQYYIEFHTELCNKVLNGMLQNENKSPLTQQQVLCSRCKVEIKASENNKYNNKKEKNQVLAWELNGIKTTEKDDFTCQLAYFEPQDPNKLPMYAKNKVYRDNIEYQFEEIRAQLYMVKYASNKAPSIVNGKGPDAHISPLGVVTDIENIPLKKDEVEKATVNVNAPELESGMPALGPLSKANAPKWKVPVCSQFPLLGQSEQASLFSESMTAHTKEALNVVQGLWDSPSPAESKPVRQNKAENNGSPPELRTGNFLKPAPPANTESVKKCVVPFPIFSETSTIENDTTTKKEEQGSCAKQLQFDIYSDKTNFSEPVPPVAPKSIAVKSLSLKSRSQESPQDTGTSAVPHLVFEEEKGTLPSHPNEDVPIQQENQSVFPTLWNKHQQEKNGEDVTAFTKAFEFPLQSSTPCHIGNADRNTQNKADWSYAALSTDKKENQQEQQKILSMILEASNEKHSSLASSNGPQSTVKNHIMDLDNNLLLDDSGDVDPFSHKLIDAILGKLKFPLEYNLNSYHFSTSSVPSLGKSTKIGNEIYTVQGDIGRGNYARVVKASVDDRTYALKVEKPTCIWEYYICCQIRTRIPSDKLSLFGDVKSAYFYQNGSILVTEWAKYGNLLDIFNQYKIHTGKSLDPFISTYLSLQVMEAIDYLHRAQIIHADVKPDNFVLKELPSIERFDEGCVQLIDFGRCIDMQVLPPGTKFTVVVNTDDFKCNEMKEKRPWTYQTDFYGLAGTIYCIFAGDYMKVIKKSTGWTLRKTLPRYMNRETWEPIFNSLLNVESCDCLPNLQTMKAPMLKTLQEVSKNKLSQVFNYFGSIMNKKK